MIVGGRAVLMDQNIEATLMKFRRQCYLRAHDFCRVQLVNSQKCTQMLKYLKK